MKSLLATAFLTALMANSAMAQVRLETRVFHSNLRLDAGRTTGEVFDSVSGLSSEPTTLVARSEEDMGEAFFNTAGLGASLIAPVNETVEFGLGVSFARYNPVPENELNQYVLNGFTRFNLVQTSTAKFYVMAGVSRQQLTQHFEGNEFARSQARYTPVVNGDLGLGTSFQVDKVDIGLEYKYSNTLAPGRGSLKSSWKIPGLAQGSGKLTIRDLVLEGQELALTCGIKL